MDMEQQRENSCCIELKRRYLKLDQKRNALRQAVQMLTLQLEQVQSENLHLKDQASSLQNNGLEVDKRWMEEESAAKRGLEKEVNNLKSKLSSLQMEKEKESNGKRRLEKELDQLKSELLSLKEEKHKTYVRNDIQQLEVHMLDAETEMERLRKLLEEERKMVELERRNSQIEKQKSSDAWTLVKTERKKAEEQRRLGEIERKKADEFKLLVEKTRIEMANVEEELKAVRNQAESASRRTKMEREKAKEKKTNAKLEREKVDALRKTAEAEKKNAETERAKAELLRKAAEVEKERMMEEKSRADDLFQQLKLEVQKRAGLEKEVAKRVQVEKERSQYHSFEKEMSVKHICDDCAEWKNVKAKVLKEALKLEKKRAKCARESARIQETENRLLWKELDSMKHCFTHVVQRQNMLDRFFLHTTDGVGFSNKHVSSLDEKDASGRGEFSNVLSQCHCLQYRNEFVPAQLKNLCSFNCSGAARVCVGSLPPDLIVSCHCHQGSGIKSDLESPTGDSFGKMKQTSVACSATASFSDGKFVGSQERNQSLAPPATGLRCRSASSISGEACEFEKNKGTGALSAKKCGTKRDATALSVKPAVYDAVLLEDHPLVKKKRRIQTLLDCIIKTCSEDNKLHLKVKESLTALSDLIFETKLAQSSDPLDASNSTRLHSSRILNEIQSVGNLRGDISEEIKYPEKFLDPDYQTRESEATKVMLSDSLGKGRVDDHATLEKDFPCLHNPHDSLEEEEINAFSSVFEDMLNGNIMKIFELDNFSDEERFRAAIAAPLSPTLPVLDPPSTEQSGNAASGDMHSKMIACEESDTALLDNLDVIGLEVGLSKQKSRSSDSFARVILRENVKIPKETKVRCMDTLHKELNDERQNHKHYFASEMNNMPEKVDISTSSTIGKSSVDSQIGSLQHSVESGSKIDYGGDINLREAQMCLPSLVIEPRMEKSSPGPSIYTFNESSELEINHLGSVLVAKEPTKSGRFSTESTSGTCQRILNSPIPLENLALNEDSPISSGARDLLPAMKLNQSSSVMDLESSDIIATAKVGVPFNASGSQYAPPSRFSIVIFSTKDEDDTCRIASAVYALACKMSTVDRKCLWKFLFAGLDIDLQTEDKVCIFLSVLIDQYSGLLPPISKCSWDDNRFPDSIKTEIQTVVSEAVRQPFQDTCKKGNLLCLIQDFLVCRKFFNCVPIQDPLNSSYPTYPLGGSNLKISPENASHNQLVAASLILASSCSILGNVDFLQEVSCNILLSCRDDFTWALDVLHVFASFSGIDFILDYKDFMPAIVIRSAVLLLESRHAAISANMATENSSNSFCKICPFAQNLVSVDDVIQILLRKLEETVKSGFDRSPHPKAVAINSIEYIPESYFSSETFKDDKVLSCTHANNHAFDASSKNNDVLARLSHSSVDENFSFMDMVSFLELLGCHLDWHHISDKILPDLLRLSESCSNKEYSVALLLLIGKLSGFGVGAGGYGQKIVADVRAFLVRHLDSSACEDYDCLRLQFAAFEAVLDLLPTNLREKLMEGGETLNLVDDSFPEFSSIQDWISQLNAKHKVLLQGVLHCGDIISNS